MGGPSEGACSYTRPQEPSSAMINCEREQRRVLRMDIQYVKQELPGESSEYLTAPYQNGQLSFSCMLER